MHDGGGWDGYGCNHVMVSPATTRGKRTKTATTAAAIPTRVGHAGRQHNTPQHNTCVQPRRTWSQSLTLLPPANMESPSMTVRAVAAGAAMRKRASEAVETRMVSYGWCGGGLRVVGGLCVRGGVGVGWEER